jgi:choline dehydrogenase-like flavoprotein
MHISYLPRAARAGARIFSRARVDRILVEGDSAVGVEVSLLGHDGRARGSMTIDAPTVVVCAGAVHTPLLLRSSAIRDPSHQTGRNLRIHPATGVGALFAEDVHNWKGTLQSYYIDQFFDSHELMFEATTTVPGVGAGSLPGIGAPAMRELDDFGKLVTLGFYVSDTSSGSVRKVPSGDALITYRLNDLDLHRMAIGIAIAAEVLLAAGAAKVHPGLPGLDAISAREDLEQLRSRRVRADHLKLTAFHPMGTVRMGRDPARSVVDSYGRHHHLAGLRVADASTFPSCVGVNPQMTIMAFAMRTAEALLASK